MSIDEIKKLNVKDRIILMNEIWETLYTTEDNFDSPSWHKDILDKRIDKIKNNEANYISLEELKTR